MNNVMAIMAHADDEVLGCGGTLTKLANENWHVSVAFMTDGVSARNSGEAKQEAIDRRAAARDAGRILNVRDVIFHDFPDNAMDTVPLIEIVRTIEKLICEFRPKMIFTHHGSDLNVDHQLTYRAVMTACRPVAENAVRYIYSCEVPSSTEWSHEPPAARFNPSIFTDITKHEQTKIDAMYAYKNEMCAFPHPRSEENIRALCRHRGAIVGVNSAEAFQAERVLY